MKKLGLVLTAITGLGAISANAAPYKPGEVEIPNFSQDVLTYFTILRDTESANLLYYVPKAGMVQVNSPQSPYPRVSLSAFAYYPTFGFWAGNQLARVGGTFSSVIRGPLLELEQEAQALGYTITPAPVTGAKANFVVDGRLAEDGRIDVTCEWEQGEFYPPGAIEPIVINIPNCELNGSPYDLSTNGVLNMATTTFNAANTVSNVGFQATIAPDFVAPLQGLLAVGASWDSLLIGEVEWEISAESKSHRVEFDIHWDALFEQLDAWARIHDGRCFDFEVSYFFQDIAECNNGRQCGVDVWFYDSNGKRTKTPPSNAGLIEAAKTLQTELEDELFNEVAEFNQSVLGPVERTGNAFFTVKANYEKRTMTRNETRVLLYNPGASTIRETTVMNIDCATTPYLGGLISWDMNSEACVDLIR